MRREGQEIYTEFLWEELLRMNLLDDRKRDERIRRTQVHGTGYRSSHMIGFVNNICGLCYFIVS
jgi:hypothetical protein